MCGILALFGASGSCEDLRARMLKLQKRLRHRGPDWSGLHVQDEKEEGSKNIICHERLAVVNPRSGEQPLFDSTGKVCAAVNGEIYNHQELRKLLPDVKSEDIDASDCAVIPYLWKKFGKELVHKLDGMWAFVISDEETGEIFAARDPIGISPLYIGWRKDGAVMFASEFKAICDECVRFEIFQPGHYFHANTKTLDEFEMERWYSPVWWNRDHMPTTPYDGTKIRETLEKAVEKRLMSDVPFGVLLSGGLDSSLIASITCRKMKEMKKEDHTSSHNVFDKLHSFSIGLENSPDLKAAKKVADYLGTVHHSFTYTVQDGLDAVSDVIYHLETYDVTTIRASTPMYLMSRKIKAMGVKMVLSGEGADEVFGGYLYFHKAPNKKAFHQETLDKMRMLHMYDVNRANKSTMAFGLEARVPFLDKEFLDVSFDLDPQEKMIVPGKRIEKWAVRQAFADQGYLPDEILWRQKEQFSDGVGYGWIDGLKDTAEKAITDKQMQHAHLVFPHNTPTTKEAYYYRQIFAKHFPQDHSALMTPGGPSVACSTPAAIEWDAAFKANADASGRSVLGVHVDEKQFEDAKKADAKAEAASKKRKAQEQLVKPAAHKQGIGA